ncbi:MAG: hypothetical protein ACTSXU_15985, partial [Promethearchaeota archaeon]
KVFHQACILYRCIEDCENCIFAPHEKYLFSSELRNFNPPLQKGGRKELLRLGPQNSAEGEKLSQKGVVNRGYWYYRPVFRAVSTPTGANLTRKKDW